MAIAFDNSQYTDTSESYSYTCAIGAVLVVGIVLRDTGNTKSVTSVTYGGQSGSFVSTTSTMNRVFELWIVNTPPSGSNTLSYTLSGGTSNGQASLAMSYTGAILSGQPNSHGENTTGGSQATISASATTTVDNCWLVAIAQLNNGGTISAGAGTFLRNNVGEVVGFDSNGPKSPAGSYSLTGNTASNSTNGYQMNLLALAPSTNTTNANLLMFI